MKKFTNKNVQKEKNLMVRKIAIFFVIIMIAIGLKVWENQMSEKVNSEMTDLDSLIVSIEENEDKKAYLDIKSKPFQFAVADGVTESYYIVTDGEYLYIAYMDQEDFEKLNHDEIEQTPVRVEGITKKIPDEIKDIAIEVYNEGLEEEDKIKTDEDFYKYFGDIYLNMSVTENSDVMMVRGFFFIVLIFGVIGFIVSVWNYISFGKTMEKMDNGLLSDLDEEMNHPDAFYYEKTHLYLTNHYIVNFNGKFVAINYQDIVWMYPYEQRTNGIKTTQAIKVMNNEGKTYTIATVSAVTKAQKAVYDEIWNTIVSKNSNIKLGYTKENINEMKERFKKK